MLGYVVLRTDMGEVCGNVWLGLEGCAKARVSLASADKRGCGWCGADGCRVVR